MPLTQLGAVAGTGGGAPQAASIADIAMIIAIGPDATGKLAPMSSVRRP